MSNPPQNFLAIDTSCETCSVALYYEGCTFQQSSDEPRSHAQRLLPMIDALLSQAHISVTNLDYIALVNGPGSFTGVRIALSIAQGLAYAANLPLFCESSLRTMARALQLNRDCRAFLEGELNSEAMVVTALDARMNEIYWAAFRFPPNDDAPLPVSEPLVSSKSDFDTALGEMMSNSPIIAAGNGFDVAELSAGINFAFKDTSISPSAGDLLSLVRVLVHSRENLMSVGELEPLYLRNEVAWKKRVRVRS